jgi:hypothetical protein
LGSDMAKSLDYTKPGGRITAEDRDEIVDAVLQALKITVYPPLTMVQNHGGTAIGIRLDSGDGSFWAKITGSAADGTNRWKYAWQEVTPPTAGGYGTWVNGSRSGTTTTNPARNTVENYNSGSGLQGNGVDITNLSGTSFTLKAVPSNAAIVRMYVATGYYWFQYENAVDGTCE